MFDGTGVNLFRDVPGCVRFDFVVSDPGGVCFDCVVSDPGGVCFDFVVSDPGGVRFDFFANDPGVTTVFMSLGTRAVIAVTDFSH